ncbi:hypothetical protein CHU98_g11929, partial [Xylaria longipes]
LIEVPAPVTEIVSFSSSIPYRKQVRAGPGSGVALHHVSNGPEVAPRGRVARTAPGALRIALEDSYSLSRRCSSQAVPFQLPYSTHISSNALGCAIAISVCYLPFAG